MDLQPTEIHVWSADLTITADQEKEKLAKLNPEECERAQRFRFPIHRQRFIAARCALREIISSYLKCSPQDIVLGYTEHQKPYIVSPTNIPLQFNLAHSDDIAVYGLTLNHPIGIDIEKIQGTYNQSVAERYFSPQENSALKKMSDEEKLQGFFRIWSRKEALVKAVGKGFSIPLSSFSVSAAEEQEIIKLENQDWSLLPLKIHPNYQSALASNQPIGNIKFFK